MIQTRFMLAALLAAFVLSACSGGKDGSMNAGGGDTAQTAEQGDATQGSAGMAGQNNDAAATGAGEAAKPAAGVGEAIKPAEENNAADQSAEQATDNADGQPKQQ